ncbi:DUF1993 family protein [Pelomonas sp. KK5]|uniref:DUF1993 domain-containing protein n=1 Tax=Pelomonas sp. KK5 TaxID=1855730 RepID=UPI001301CEB3|nr:DUF1993 domain-containing protein [Pelomonas sp. KK5]
MKAVVSSIALHDASVPVFLRYLDRLRGLVDTAGAFAEQHARPMADLLAARLAPDMLPFETQVVIAANFALRACFPLAGLAIPPYGEFPSSSDGLRRRIDRVASLLKTLEPQRFEGAESRVIESRAGDALVALKGPEFLLQYALPNFFFHLTAAYAVLRSQGVPLGKESYDGFHCYREQP